MIAMVAACAAAPDESIDGAEHVADVSEALSSLSCGASKAAGYVSGKETAIVVVTVDGKPVQRDTANAYYLMAKAAAADGVQLYVVSGFRTMAQQQYLYNCYQTCSCNGCNLAALPGYSNHQSGKALDLNTSAAGVYGWLDKHGAAFGFHRTVPSEAWHWEYLGKTPVGGPCGSPDAELSAAWSNAKKGAQGKVDYRVCSGDKFKLWLRFRNSGTTRWADLGAGAKFAGERVWLVSVGGKDALTGLAKISLDANGNGNVLPSNWGAGAGKDCDDQDGCLRTVFTAKGLAAVAPDKPGTYLSAWRLADASSGTAQPFGATAKLTFAVDACAPSGDRGSGSPPPDESGAGSGTGSGAGSDDRNLPALGEMPAEQALPEGDAAPERLDAHGSCAFVPIPSNNPPIPLVFAGLAAIAACSRRRRDA